MKNGNLIFSILIIELFIYSGVFGYDWSQKSISVVDSTNDGTKTMETLKDNAGNTFKVSSLNTEISPESADTIIGLKNDFYSWKNMKLNSLEFMVSENSMDISVVPASLTIDGTNVASNLPAGLFFFYTDKLHYNFRMQKDNLFLRIYGRYQNESELDKKIMSAYRDPSGYFRLTDPAFLPSRVEELEDAVKILQATIIAMERKNFSGNPEAITPDLVKKTIQIKKDNPTFKKKDVYQILQKQNAKISDRDVGLILSVYFGEYE